MTANTPEQASQLRSLLTRGGSHEFEFDCMGPIIFDKREDVMHWIDGTEMSVLGAWVIFPLRGDIACSEPLQGQE